MSGQPRRPVFSEGQVLAAADLNLVDGERRRSLALHARSLHGWGIAEGLELNDEEATLPDGTLFRQLSLSPGVAVDGTGRQIVVAQPTPLREAAFEQVNGTTVTQANRDTWFPVLLSGRDEDAPVEGVATGSCGAAATTSRIVEAFEITFGRAGEEHDLDEQPPPPVDAGPDDPRSGRPWRVLLGFVRWNPDTGRFSEQAPEANGVRRRYASVKADEVTARAGRAEVRTRIDAALGTPAVVIDEQDGGRFAFGLHNGSGGFTELFQVSAKGDVTAQGSITPALASGSVHVQSGVATDGVVLPLPPGLTEAEVLDGRVTLHITTTLHTPPSLAPSGTSWAIPLECEVDSDRRVRCRAGWINTGNFAIEDVPAACDYLIVATRISEAGT